MKASCLEVNGKLGNVKGYDMTNYPKTIDSNLNNKKLKPYQILGRNKDLKTHIMDLSFISYTEGHPKIQNNIKSYLKMNIYKMQYTHMQ